MQPFGTSLETVSGVGGGTLGNPIFGVTGLTLGNPIFGLAGLWELGFSLAAVSDLLEDARFDLECAECATWRGVAAEAAFEFRVGLLEQLGDLQLLLERARAIAGGG